MQTKGELSDATREEVQLHDADAGYSGDRNRRTANRTMHKTVEGAVPRPYPANWSGTLNDWTEREIAAMIQQNRLNSTSA